MKWLLRGHNEKMKSKIDVDDTGLSLNYDYANCGEEINKQTKVNRN